MTHATDVRSNPKYSSGVWMHFKKQDGNQAQCCVCECVIHRNNPSTTLLRRHLMIQHPVQFQTVRSFQPSSKSRDKV